MSRPIVMNTTRRLSTGKAAVPQPRSVQARRSALVIAPAAPTITHRPHTSSTVDRGA